ncbi:hypothetical protein H6CHR_01130 [Variovorax sp. PBL-H6]|nr:hypothetical protein H6CHR_01130 [Variovorax sp. PBL-H6]
MAIDHDAIANQKAQLLRQGGVRRDSDAHHDRADRERRPVGQSRAPHLPVALQADDGSPESKVHATRSVKCLEQVRGR